MPDAQYQNSNMSFATCGTDLFSPHRTTTIPTLGRPLSECSNEFAIFTLPCMKALIPRDRHSPNLAMMILPQSGFFISLMQYSPPYFNCYTTSRRTSLHRGDCETHQRHRSLPRHWHLPRATSGPRVYPLSLYPGHCLPIPPDNSCALE
jgi:hypothetical protein